MPFDRVAVPRVVAAVFVAAVVGTSPAAAQGDFDDEGDVTLANPRVGHTATLLEDDYVLIAGGSDGATELASVELVDPIGGDVEVLGDMDGLRSGHTATLLPDGLVLIAGGMADGNALPTAELYDPLFGGSGPTGALQWARTGHTATLLPDGRVLITGGLDGDESVARAEIFDPASGTFTKVAKAKSPHLGSASTLLSDGRVLVTGTAAKKKARPAERYDPVKDKWAPVKGSTGKRAGHTSTLLEDGHVLLAGGSDGEAEIGPAQLFDPADDSFAPVSGLTAPRSGHTATLLPDARVAIIGGADAGFEVAAIEIFDAASGAFEVAGEMEVPRTGHSATPLPDGRVLVTGGRFATMVLDDVLVYDPVLVSIAPLGDDTVVDPEPLEVALAGTTRADVRAELGSPEGFAIYYFDDVGPDETATTTSLELWTYYRDGVEFTFDGDQLIAEEPLDAVPQSEVQPVPYDPDQFSPYMNLEEIVAVAGVEEFLGGEFEEADGGGEVYFADQLTWGLKDGELRYVEALALEPEATSAEGE